jgi:hypothetical protein
VHPRSEARGVAQPVEPDERLCERLLRDVLRLERRDPPAQVEHPVLMAAHERRERLLVSRAARLHELGVGGMCRRVDHGL